MYNTAESCLIDCACVSGRVSECACDAPCLCYLLTSLPLPWLIWQRFPLICYNTHPHTYTLSLPASYSHTRAHTYTRSLSLAHARTHARARTHTHTHILSNSSSLPMRCTLAESWAREERHGGGYLPDCNLQAGYQDRLQLWGRELASQHSGELLVSSSADHSEAEPRRGENKSAMFSYTNHWAGGKYKCHTHLLSAALRSLFPDSGRPRACLPLHVFNIDCCQTLFFFLSLFSSLSYSLSSSLSLPRC